MRTLIRFTRWTLAAATALLALGWAGSAHAQLPGRLNSPVAKACGQDLRAHCSGVAPGDGRLVACLQQHQAGLSASCQALLPQLDQCSGELKRLCGPAGDGSAASLRRCASARQDQLTPACRQLTLQ